jgi:hypothetical protein
MKQTAVEWLVGELTFKTTGGVYTTDGIDDVTHLVEQAKAMEKEHIMQSVNDGKLMALGTMENKSLEKYYNETFNTKEK